jgi:hypothetical protein
MPNLNDRHLPRHMLEALRDPAQMHQPRAIRPRNEMRMEMPPLRLAGFLRSRMDHAVAHEIKVKRVRLGGAAMPEADHFDPLGRPLGGGLPLSPVSYGGLTRSSRRSALRRSERPVSKDFGGEWAVGERVHRVASLAELQNRLRARGWEQVGAGYYGTAHAKGGLVWKISSRHDDGYKVWAWMVLTGKLAHRCANLPRIKLMLVDDTGACAVLMERLDCTLGEAIFGQKPAHTRHHRAAMAFEADHDRFHYNGKLTGFDPKHAEIFHILRLLRLGMQGSEQFEGAERLTRHSEDFHRGNFMLRKDGTVVITDPIC